jgi:hypothetical protein
MPGITTSPGSLPCLAVLAGNRIITALKAWERELELEINPDLGKIVTPLASAFEISKMDLKQASLAEAVHCRRLCERLLLILQGISDGVTEPWQLAKASGPEAFGFLSGKWKDSNPLHTMLDDLQVLKHSLEHVSTGPVHHCQNCLLIGT